MFESHFLEILERLERNPGCLVQVLVVEKEDLLEPGAIKDLSWEGSYKATGDFSDIHKVTYSDVPAALKLQTDDERAERNIEFMRAAGSHPTILP